MTPNKTAKITQKIIHHLEEPSCTRFTVGMLVSSGYYVYSDVLIDDLVDELVNNENIFALAVVDKNVAVQGVIVRKELFDILGRRFGRELYYKKNVTEVMNHVGTLNYNMHIFECSKVIEKDLLTGAQEYYALIDENNCYKGIFSTKDMLIFLSRLAKLDIDHAKRVVNRIISKEYLVQTKCLTIAVKNKMVQDIGGDFYCVIPLKNKNYHIVIVGDVSGKGIAASMITTLIHGMITTYDFDSSNIEYFIKHLNNYIFSTFEGEKFVTTCFIIIDEDNALLTMYDFGHSLTYLYRGSGMFKLSLKENNMPMGIQKIESINSGIFKLEKGDIVTVLTDGCIEQRNSNCEDYGIKRFNRVFINNYNYNSDPIKILNSIMFDIENFCGSYPQQDDMTIGCIVYN